MVWQREDLVRRVGKALDIAERAVHAAVPGDRAAGPLQTSVPVADEPTPQVRPLVLPKVAAEAALLMRCAEPIGDIDERVRTSIARMGGLLDPHARNETLRTRMVLDSASALDQAFTHIHLQSLGIVDDRFDQLLRACHDVTGPAGPERPPHRELEQRWIHHIWTGRWPDPGEDADLLRRSIFGRPIDALSNSTQDLYAFTHVILYASDMGRRIAVMPRPAEEITADAEVALAAALDADNFDLTAELLWTWPMLRLPFSAAAQFAFELLASVQDSHGFLPGPEYSAAELRQRPADGHDRYVLQTSYHTTLVMGLLCAAAVNSHCLPPAPPPASAQRTGAPDDLRPLLREQRRSAQWSDAFDRLGPGRREPLSGLVRDVALIRAGRAADLPLVRKILETAVGHDLIDGPAVTQSAALLRRAAALTRVTNWTA